MSKAPSKLYTKEMYEDLKARHDYAWECCRSADRLYNDLWNQVENLKAKNEELEKLAAGWERMYRNVTKNDAVGVEEVDG